MQALSLQQILDLVGQLNDAGEETSARFRFRRFLSDELDSVGQARDYIEECLRKPGDQFNKALQDLVNHTASLLGFEVEYGRYRGIRNDIGFDGLWKWGDRFIVVEVKTTDTYSISTSVLLGYINRLISEGRIRNDRQVLGLYVFGRSDSQLKEVANSIIAEGRTTQLRIATSDDLLTLAELVQESLITTEEAVTLLWPGSVFVADNVQLLARLASQGELAADASAVLEEPPSPATGQLAAAPPTVLDTSTTESPMHLITPVSDDGETVAPDIIRGLLDAGWYVFGEHTAGRRELKPGDRICFYQSTVGVVAECEVASRAELQPLPRPDLAHDPERFPWRFQVRKPRYFFDNPTVIDRDLRARLDAFSGRDLSKSWAWFVQGTRKINSHDFGVLTQQEDVP